AAGAFHALGKAYFSQGKQKQAARYLIQSLQAVDTALNEDEGELTSLYNQLLATLEGRSNEALAAINTRFINLLGGKEWKQRISETRRQLEDTLRDQGEQGVVDILVASQGDRLTESVSLIDKYMRQGLYTLAIDEAHRAVEFSPFYLPVHVRMAEIMMKEG